MRLKSDAQERQESLENSGARIGTLYRVYVQFTEEVLNDTFKRGKHYDVARCLKECLLLGNRHDN